MSQQNSASPAPSLSKIAVILVCVIASIGFAFDIYELLMLPLIFRYACEELGGIRSGTPEFSQCLGIMFYMPAFLGGIFGLLGGYLTDRFGRRRVLTFSILLYAVKELFWQATRHEPVHAIAFAMHYVYWGMR